MVDYKLEKQKAHKNASRIIEICCQVKKGEKVLIISDTKSPEIISQELFKAVKEKAGEPVIGIMDPVTPGGKLPEMINLMAKAADVIIAATSTSIYHSEGIRIACQPPYNARHIALSEWTEDTLMQGGIEADFVAIKPKVMKAKKIFDKGKNLKLRTPAGTDIVATIDGRIGYANTGIADLPGIKMGLPTIEVFIAPVESSVNGQIVIDASCSGGIGVIRAPITLTVRQGKVITITGGEQAEQLRNLIVGCKTDNAYQVAEIAVGLNPQCRITGNINEDEGKYGTCHIALGNNLGFGGLNDAPLHIDMVQWHPTLEIDGQLIFTHGQLLD